MSSACCENRNEACAVNLLSMLRDLAGFATLPEINDVNAGGLRGPWLIELGSAGSSGGHNSADINRL